MNPASILALAALTISAAIGSVAAAPQGASAAPPDAQAARDKDVIYVDDSAPTAGDGRAWRSAYRHLQDALTHARRPSAGVKEIRIAQGVYKPDRGAMQVAGDQHATLDLIDKIAVRGGYRGAFAGPGRPDDRNITAFVTALSGDLGVAGDYDDNSFHVATASYLGPQTVLDGMTIRDGTHDPDWPLYGDGALICFGGAPLIQNCSFVSNEGLFSSGCVDLNFSDAIFRGCRFESNFVSWRGGAMSIGGGSPVIENCLFAANVAYLEAGGAIAISGSTATFRRCSFLGNGSGNEGGAAHMHNSLFTRFEDCDFVGNATAYGGGAVRGEFTAVDCRFIDNQAGQYGGAVDGGGAFIRCLFQDHSAGTEGGGAVYGWGDFVNCTFRGNWAYSLVGGGGACSLHLFPSEFTNCVFAGNESNGPGGAIHVGGSASASLFNCTLTGNIGQGSNSQAIIGDAVLRNSIIWGNVGGDVPAGMSAISCCLPGPPIPSQPSNIHSDPLFLNPAGDDGVIGTADDDLRLAAGSPCIDHGSNLFLPFDFFDLDGDGVILEALPLDILGSPRVIDDPATPDYGSNWGLPGIVDMGAYEFVP